MGDPPSNAFFFWCFDLFARNCLFFFVYIHSAMVFIIVSLILLCNFDVQVARRVERVAIFLLK